MLAVTRNVGEKILIGGHLLVQLTHINYLKNEATLKLTSNQQIRITDLNCASIVYSSEYECDVKVSGDGTFNVFGNINLGVGRISEKQLFVRTHAPREINVVRTELINRADKHRAFLYRRNAKLRNAHVT